MNQKDVKIREVLSFEKFIEVTSQPFNPKNFSDVDRSAFHKIKLDKRFEDMGFGDAVFKHLSKINYPATSANSGISADIGVTE